MAREDRRKARGALPRLFSDAPEEDARRLAFEFEGLARTLADLALNPDNETPFSVVVRGDWGRGKTTLLRRTRAILDAEGTTDDAPRRVKPLWFNAWKYPQEDSVLAGLLGELIGEFRTGTLRQQFQILLDEHKEWLARTILRVPLRLMLNFESRYQPIEEKRAFYDHFSELFGQLTHLWFHGKIIPRDNVGKTLAGSGCAVAVFLDDLDRCRQERVLDVLEAIKLFLDQPGVCFYLGLSWQRLVEILKESGRPEPDEFLEKIVQVGFDIPEVSEEGAGDFVGCLIAGSPLERIAGTQVETISHALSSRQPRHIKRFLNDLSIRLGVLENTGHLGAGPNQLTKARVLSWHLLLESLPAERRREVTLNLGNLEKLLLELVLLEQEGASAKEKVGAEVVSAWERKGLASHAQSLTSLSPAQKSALVNLGSPPRLESAPRARAVHSEASDFLKPDSPWWVPLSGGTFRMGSDDGRSDEKPHVVHLSNFSISRFPVTNEQYAYYVEDTGARFPLHWHDGVIPSGKEDHPVVNVSWNDAVGFCKWLSERTGRLA